MAENQASAQIAYVLFVDIVGFSRLTISAQAVLLDRLNTAVRASRTFVQAEAARDVMPLPTGDGVALLFFTNVFDPARCAIEVCRDLRSSAAEEPPIRMGIHCGLVQRQIDIAGRDNVVGEGINTAQRVMDFGDAGHILLSAQYANWLQQFDEWLPRIHLVGEGTVKHSVKLLLYGLCDGDHGSKDVPSKLLAQTVRAAFAAQEYSAITLQHGSASHEAALHDRAGLLADESAPSVLPQTQPRSDNLQTHRSAIVGRRIGNVEVLELVGQGDAGAIYRGFDQLLERDVAIKVLHTRGLQDPARTARLRKEAKTLAKLSHPNIAMLHDLKVEGDELFMIMEFLLGQSVAEIIIASGAIAAGTAIPMFCQALAGIEHAHANGILHRDIKPANLLVTESGTLKIVDFGIASVLGSAREEKPGWIKGTYEYMSPEACRAQDGLDVRSDIYSLGVTLYQMLTGHLPFEGGSGFEIMRGHVELPLPSPLTHVPDLPDDIVTIIATSLEKEPRHRFQNTSEFRASLEATPLEKSALNSTVAALHDVFVAYAHEDQSIADAIVSGLEAGGVRCWISSRDILPGQNFAEAIVAAIGGAKLMVLVHSKNANQSPHVAREVELASDGRITILPYCIDNEPPSGAIRYFVSSHQSINAGTEPVALHIRSLRDAILNRTVSAR